MCDDNIRIVHVVSCQPLPDINNGSATCSLGDNGVPSFNDTCDVICNAGYLLRGNPTRTCLSDGSWSGTDDECIESMLCMHCDFNIKHDDVVTEVISMIIIYPFVDLDIMHDM